MCRSWHSQPRFADGAKFASAYRNIEKGFPRGCAALEGTQGCLKRGRDPNGALKVFFETYYSDHLRFGNFAALLALHNYPLHRLCSISFSDQNGRPHWADAKFFRAHKKAAASGGN